MELLSYLLQPKPGDKARKSRDDEDEAAEDQEERRRPRKKTGIRRPTS